VAFPTARQCWHVCFDLYQHGAWFKLPNPLSASAVGHTAAGTPAPAAHPVCVLYAVVGVAVSAGSCG
jgi:hypothetical protein